MELPVSETMEAEDYEIDRRVTLRPTPSPGNESEVTSCGGESGRSSKKRKLEAANPLVWCEDVCDCLEPALEHGRISEALFVIFRTFVSRCNIDDGWDEVLATTLPLGRCIVTFEARNQQDLCRLDMNFHYGRGAANQGPTSLRHLTYIHNLWEIPHMMIIESDTPGPCLTDCAYSNDKCEVIATFAPTKTGDEDGWKETMKGMMTHYYLILNAAPKSWLGYDRERYKIAINPPCLKLLMSGDHKAILGPFLEKRQSSMVPSTLIPFLLPEDSSWDMSVKDLVISCNFGGSPRDTRPHVSYACFELVMEWLKLGAGFADPNTFCCDQDISSATAIVGFSDKYLDVARRAYSGGVTEKPNSITMQRDGSSYVHHSWCGVAIYSFVLGHMVTRKRLEEEVEEEKNGEFEWGIDTGNESTLYPTWNFVGDTTKPSSSYCSDGPLVLFEKAKGFSKKLWCGYGNTIYADGDWRDNPGTDFLLTTCTGENVVKEPGVPYFTRTVVFSKNHIGFNTDGSQLYHFTGVLALPKGLSSDFEARFGRTIGGLSGVN